MPQARKTARSSSRASSSFKEPAALKRLNQSLESAQKALQTSIEKHPGHLPEALLCAANCAELGPILRGEKDAVHVLFSGSGAELLDQFYGGHPVSWRLFLRIRPSKMEMGQMHGMHGNLGNMSGQKKKP